MKKIFIVAHKPIYIPESTLLFPLSADSIEGINIADKQGYSELRAHYLVWKNEPNETDVVGFFQFRRYLDFCSELLNKPVVPPYTIKRFPKASTYDDDLLSAYMKEADVIAPVPEYTGVSVRERYRYAKGHDVADINCICDIIKNTKNDFAEAMEQYLNGENEYYGNIYIMKRDAFDEYCSWIFSILMIFDVEKKDILPRTQGYLAERLFGIWFTKKMEEGGLSCKMLPRVHFWGYDDGTHNLRKELLLNRIIAPGGCLKASLRRLRIQRMKYFYNGATK